MNTLYYRRKAAGICTDCGRQAASAGHVACDACLQNKRDYYAVTHPKVPKPQHDLAHCLACQREQVDAAKPHPATTHWWDIKTRQPVRGDMS
jgi:hypothetical protein